MKSNELRIWNWLSWDGDYAQWNLYNFKDLEFTDSYIEAEPIPITEEWLFKFGFEKSEYLENIYKYKIYNVSLDKFGDLHFYFFGIHDCSRKIKYVHELQNLYFSLTGQELSYE